MPLSGALDEHLDLKALFGNSNPVEVDLGCGKGAFLVAEAAARPQVNFLGVDRLSRKVARADRDVKENRLGNVRLFRCEVFSFVDCYLPPSGISVIHIYFPDPWPKKKHRKRRFLTLTLMKSLARALAPKGKIYLATDFLDYYEEIEERFSQCSHFFPLKEKRPPTMNRTDFEQDFMARNLPIYRSAHERMPNTACREAP